jgi:hypothetical protein
MSLPQATLLFIGWSLRSSVRWFVLGPCAVFGSYWVRRDRLHPLTPTELVAGRSSSIPRHGSAASAHCRPHRHFPLSPPASPYSRLEASPARSVTRTSTRRAYAPPGLGFRRSTTNTTASDVAPAPAPAPRLKMLPAGCLPRIRGGNGGDLELIAARRLLRRNCRSSLQTLSEVSKQPR